MKKILIFGIVLVAIASVGGNRMNVISAHAQTLTQADAASLQASVDALKARLADLQAQANVQQPLLSVSGEPVALQQAPVTATLSEADVASLKSALSALAGVLTTLQSEFSANPGFAAQNSGGVIIALQGIGNTLAMIGTSLQGTSATPVTPVAAAPKASEPAPFAVSNPVAIAPSANNQEQTAAVSSAWSLGNLNWPLVAIVSLAVAAIALWLWWPSKEEEKGGNDKRSAKKNVQTAQPTIIVSSSGPQIAINAVRQATTHQSQVPTPLAASMSVPVVKIVPQENQRRSA